MPSQKLSGQFETNQFLSRVASIHHPAKVLYTQYGRSMGEEEKKVAREMKFVIGVTRETVNLKKGTREGHQLITVINF